MRTAIYVGHARAPSNTIVGHMYGLVQIVLEIDKETGTIVTADINLLSEVSRRYLTGMLVGRSLMAELGVIIKDIERDYHSSSQRAIVQALHDLHQIYMKDYLRIMSTTFGYEDVD